MRPISALVLLALPLAAGAPPAPPAGKPICREPGPVDAAQAGRPARFRRLGDLPPANAVLAVLRTENGCSKPVIVRYGIGSHAPDPAQAAPR